MQHKLSEGYLLNEKGELIEAGYHTELVKIYDRDMIKAGKLRIKEWDYYYIGNDKYAIALTIADNSYMNLISVSFLDFESRSYVTKSKMSLLTLGSTGLPSTSKSGSIKASNGKTKFKFRNQDNNRHLLCNFTDFVNDKEFKCDIKLFDLPRDSMVIAVPFDNDRRYFYYNQKINCISVSGSFWIGDKEYSFNNNNSLAVQDWGRGVWPYKSSWYWASISTFDNQNRKVGLNLGYGFGNTQAATENMAFLEGQHTKLDDIEFVIPKDNDNNLNLMADWKIVSKDQRVKLNFIPILDRVDKINIGILCTNQHQVFGKLYGTVALDENQTIEFDGQIGFSEVISHKW